MAVLTPNRAPAEIALEDDVRRMAATGLCEEDIATTLSRAGARGGEDALWLYSWVIGRHERDGIPPRAELPSLE